MGLLSKIWKGVKSIFSGIGKVFNAILKPVAKLFDSGFGKALMLGLAVFTMGASLIAGVQGFAQGTGFIGKFINGGKAFINTLLGTNFEVAGGGGKIPTGGIESGLPKVGEHGVPLGSEMPGEILTGEGAVGGIQAPTAPASAGPALGVEGMPAVTAAPVAEGNWLTKAATAAKDFAMSPGGGTLLGNVISGVGAGMRQKNEQEFSQINQRRFENPNDPGMLALAAVSAPAV